MRKIRDLFGGLGNQMFQHAYIVNDVKKGKIPDMYLQDEKYFEESKEDIKRMYGADIGSCDMVSLHIRRGDYIDNPFYVDLSLTDYYQKAIDLFPGETFLVFCADRQKGSDDEADMEWSKRFCEGLNTRGDSEFRFYQGLNEIDDLNKMASCKSHIMANSSFSWWAAYLGGGFTVAPMKWFTDGVERIKLLDAWKKI